VTVGLEWPSRSWSSVSNTDIGDGLTSNWPPALASSCFLSRYQPWASRLTNPIWYWSSLLGACLMLTVSKLGSELTPRRTWSLPELPSLSSTT